VSCQELSDARLWEWLDNEIPTDERAAVERHLAGCPACEALLQEMRRRPLAIGQQRLVAPPPDFHRRVMVRIAAEARRGGWVDERSPLAPLLAPRRLAALAGISLALALVSVTIVGAALAAPAVAATWSAPATPVANSLLLVMRRALIPLDGLFHEWGWLVLLLGMVAAVLIPATQWLLTRRLRRR
jgi:anti-sigma factor RsiW